VIGILSIVLCFVVFFQSCAVGVVNTLSENTTDRSGSAGVLVALCMLTAGIIAIAARSSRTGGLVTGGFYLIASLIGFANRGTYSDLVVWAIVCLILSAFFIIGSWRMPVNPKHVEKR